MTGKWKWLAAIVGLQFVGALLLQAREAVGLESLAGKIIYAVVLFLGACLLLLVLGLILGPGIYRRLMVRRFQRQTNAIRKVNETTERLTREIRDISEKR
jgi:hypothetical protein